MTRTTRLLARATSLILLSGTMACGASAAPPMAPSAMPSMPMAPHGGPGGAPMAESARAVGDMAAPPSPSPAPGSPSSAVPPAKGQVAGNTPRAPQKGKEGTPSDARPSLVVYTGALSMLTAAGKIPESIDKIIDVAESYGGGLMGRRDDGVDIRVPSQQFRVTLKELEHVADVTTRSVKAEDVTEQVHDLEVRVSNLKATQKRLQEFLTRAQNVNDALTVERELERVAQEIDTIEGRLTFLKTRASFSQISVTLREKPRDTPLIVATPEPPRAKPTAQTPSLPVPWLDALGVDPLLAIKKN